MGASENVELDLDSAMNTVVEEMAGREVEGSAGDLDTAIDTAATETVKETAPVDTTKTATEVVSTTVEADLPAPQSWKKEMHPIWDKLAKGLPMSPEESKTAAKYYGEREKQMLDGIGGYKSDAEYGRSLKGVIARHEDILRSQNLQAPQAVEFLFNAHRMLSQGTPEQRLAYLVDKVAKTYGITIPQPQAQATVAADGTVIPPAAVPPEVRQALERVERIESALAQEQTQRYEAVKASTAKEVEAFAADPAHPYFDECADDIAVFINKGMSLPDAYKKAVWANDVTRQKEISRIQQESEAARQVKVKEAVKAAKKTTSTNVKGRDTTRTPTESGATLANLDEVLRETHAEMKSRH